MRLENLILPTFKTVDNMESMINIAFRDSPIVASELVQFLALNIGFDAIESLLKSNTTMKAETVELKKQAINNSKSSSLSGNKSM